MARDLVEVWLLEAQLRAAAALHVGRGEGVVVDLALARDGAGRLVVPGTSLAGVLRALARRHWDDADVSRLFGYQQGEAGHAAWIRVADAVVSGHVELRDGVSIDRERGAAAHDFLFTREVVAAGATLTLKLEIEVDRTRVALVSRVLPQLAAILRARGLTVGAASSRGLGRLVAREVVLRRLELSRIDHVRAWWCVRADRVASWPGGCTVSLAEPPPCPGWRIEVRWRPRGPLMVKAGGAGEHIQQVPLTTRTPEGYRAVIPGASIKGALRARAERIWRTLAGASGGGVAGVHAQPAAEMEAVSDLFGRPRERGQVCRAALSVLDCHHDKAFSKDPRTWRADEDQGSRPPGDRRFPGMRAQTRIAVDRFTGGAMDSALFTQVTPPWEDREPVWQPLVFELELDRLPGVERQHRAMALLWLVLRDLIAGDIPLGFGTNQGLGAVRVERIDGTLRGQPLPSLWVRGDRTPIVDEDSAWRSHLEAWQSAWREMWS